MHLSDPVPKLLQARDCFRWCTFRCACFVRDELGEVSVSLRARRSAYAIPSTRFVVSLDADLSARLQTVAQQWPKVYVAVFT